MATSRSSTRSFESLRHFGSSTSLTHAVMNTLDQSARQLALMEKFGTNPMANFNQVVRRIEEAFRKSSDTDGLKQFQGKIDGLRNVMGRLDGSLDIPVNEMKPTYFPTFA
jgi:hypothetical protein